MYWIESNSGAYLGDGAMPDGRRKRRHSGIAAKREWYARHRAMRFRRRFGLAGDSVCQGPLARVACGQERIAVEKRGGVAFAAFC